MKTKNSVYLVLTIILVILSAIGGYFLYQINRQRSTPSVVESEILPTPTKIPIETPTITLVPTATASSSTPTPKTTLAPVCTPPPCPTGSELNCPADKQCLGGCGVVCLKPTLIPTSTPTLKDNELVEPIPVLTTYKNTNDNFSVEYLSSRNIYPDTESSGRRYTFYLYNGNFAVHVGLNDQWAWVTPNRNFSGDFLVAGQNTYRYDISTQTIVDIQYNGKNYTLQCIHNGKTSLKTECEEFISSFQFI